jgi:hypothetical protein
MGMAEGQLSRDGGGQCQGWGLHWSAATQAAESTATMAGTQREGVKKMPRCVPGQRAISAQIQSLDKPPELCWGCVFGPWSHLEIHSAFCCIPAHPDADPNSPVVLHSSDGLHSHKLRVLPPSYRTPPSVVTHAGTGSGRGTTPSSSARNGHTRDGWYIPGFGPHPGPRVLFPMEKRVPTCSVGLRV